MIEEVKMFEIEVDKNKCAGCGACVSACDNFEMKDGIANPKKSKVEKIGCSKEAAEVCPAAAIKIKKI
jgi:ferredoxin